MFALVLKCVQKMFAIISYSECEQCVGATIKTFIVIPIFDSWTSASALVVHISMKNVSKN